MVNGAKIDRILSRALGDRPTTPYEMWHNRKPILKYLKIFGSTVYIHNKIRKRKLDEKSFKTMFVGYEPNGFKLWDTENEKFIVARDVVVDETNMVNSRVAKNKTLNDS